MTRRQKLFLSIAVAAATSIAGARIQPFVPIETREPAKPILQNAQIDPATAAILARSCQNCHSEKTVWPWYSRIAPISWLIASDVQQARQRMNLSRWNEYSDTERQQLLGAIGAAVRNHEMPPQRYTALHPEAKLSDEDRNRIYQWTRAERARK